MRLIISTSQPDAAAQLAIKLVEERLAACVNVIPKVTSYYTWKGKLEQDTEALLFAKTTESQVRRLCERLREIHSYDVPEIISVEILKDEGNPDYLQWVRDSVS